MYKEFILYFFSYIIRAKTRQRLLFLAFLGLMISSFALLFIQSTMGGLQEKLISRSKTVQALMTIYLDNEDEKQKALILEDIKESQAIYLEEFEMEMLIKHQGIITPAIVHGIKRGVDIFDFLGLDTDSGISLGYDLASKLTVSAQDQIRLISPAHSDVLFGDIPRATTVRVNKVFISDVPEVDLFHAWVDIKYLYQIAREKKINRIRIYSLPKNSLKLYQNLKAKYPELLIRTWEEENADLVWSLKLESMVMLFLFVAMTLLVSLSITSGLAIFFTKIKRDLASFWILGASRKKINFSSKLLLNFLSITAITTGIIFSLIALTLFDKFGGEIMPDIFVDRKIPVYITAWGIFISFLIPYAISILFSFFSVVQFEKDDSYLNLIRQ